MSNKITSYTVEDWIKNLSVEIYQDLIKLLDFLLSFDEVNVDFDKKIDPSLLTQLGIKTPILILLLNGLAFNNVITLNTKSQNGNKPVLRINRQTIFNENNWLNINREELKRIYKLAKSTNFPQTSIDEYSIGDLKYDKRKNWFIYKKKINKNPRYAVAEFFKMLCERKGTIVEDKEVAKRLNTSNYQIESDNGKVPLEKIENRHFNREISYIMRDLKKLLLSLEVPKNLLEKMFAKKKKLGYIAFS